MSQVNELLRFSSDQARMDIEIRRKGTGYLYLITG